MNSRITGKGSVLYVENDEGLRLLVKKNLERQGYQVDTADNGEEGISMQKMNSYDVILVDQNMPAMKGTDFIQVISKQKEPVPVVMLTGSGNESIAVEALKLGASDYIVKDPQGGFLKLLSSVINRAIKENDLVKEKQELFQELERSNKELESFAYVASHDLQEPLRKIITFGDRLKELTPDMDEKGQDCLRRMIKASARMQNFIDSLLSYSKVQKSLQDFQKVNLTNAVQEALSNLETRLEQTNGVVNVTELPDLEANPLQMRQLFQNLIGNALKYCKKEESPVVQLSSSKDRKDNWEIRVEDNGIGFEKKYADRVFKLFERLHGKSDYEGTGIGLAICEKIVKFHKGKITVESEVGKGTTFIITLPEKQ